jgi:hypothetical protein
MSNEDFICIPLNTQTSIFFRSLFQKEKVIKIRHYRYAHDINFILRELRTS